MYRAYRVSRVLAAFLSAALLLSGCGKGEESPPPPAASSPAASSEAAIQEPAQALQSSRPQGPYPAPLSVLGPQGVDLEPLFDSYYGTFLQIPQESTFSFAFAPGTALNFLRVSPIGRCQIKVEAGGRMLYDANTESSSPLPKEGLTGGIICRFDDTEADRFTLTVTPLEEGVCLDETAFGLLEQGLPASAYLPASTKPKALGEYRESLALLRQVTLITGACWDAQGEVQVIDQNYPALLAALKEYAGEDGPKILSTFYPARELVRAGSAGESVATPERRSALIRSLIAHCEEYGLDGIDFDWETPKDESEWAFYSALITEAAKALEERGLLLSAALYPGDCQYLSSEAVAALPTLNLMAYDQFDDGGRHSTYLAAYEAAAKARGVGFAPAQLCLGIPTYGRPLDGSASWPLYRDAALGYAQNEADGAYYNSPALARDKAAFAALEGFGGVFLYHLGGDLPAPDRLSLLQSLR
ncbi:glycoside hydrolase family 18 protein [Harryflintia acetispora]|uniref:glycoside hydrolase family 18 protein n=1 Tax=Harryflintia acetispora TaxID=1849041 RepID=UPI001898E080|nr:glycoside hydrolase family 18 protein [Harryflintia acetispora]